MVLALALAALARPAPADDAVARKALEAAYARWDTVWNKDDPKLFLAFFEKDTTPDWSFRHYMGEIDTRKQEEDRVRGQLKEGRLQGQPGQSITNTTTINELKVAGDTAVANVLEIVNVTPTGSQGKRRSHHLAHRRRDTWVKTPEGWKARSFERVGSTIAAGPSTAPDAYNEALRQYAPAAGSPGSSDVAAVRTALEVAYARESRARAQARQKPDALAEFFQKETTADFTLTRIQGDTVTREELNKGRVKLAAASSQGTDTKTIEGLRVTGDTATALVRFEVGERASDIKGPSWTNTIYYRDTWVKTAEGWKLKSRDVLKSIGTGLSARK
jgi:hypothetical protein